VIDRQIAKLVRIVDDLLDIARIEHDQIDLRKERLDLGQLVKAALEDSRHLVDDRRHSLLVSLPSEPIRLMADPVRIEQVVSNLLSNAAKYTDPGGTIGVELERSGEEAILTVRDNGIGIAPEMLPQLFEMFFQSRNSLARTGGGLGIGLSVSKRLVELHGGRIDGKSTGLGKGSEFRVHLPISPEVESHEPSQVQAISKPAKSSGRHRILLVDDYVDTVETVAELARAWGHEVAVAHDGRMALEIASQFRPDLAVIDIGLPEMNGYELARRLRQLPAIKGVPLVAMSGYGRNEDRKESQEAGFNLHLVKPVDAARLAHLFATLDVDQGSEK
jgi:two-component system CheB/CheR fusion protein